MRQRRNQRISRYLAKDRRSASDDRRASTCSRRRAAAKKSANKLVEIKRADEAIDRGECDHAVTASPAGWGGIGYLCEADRVNLKKMIPGDKHEEQQTRELNLPSQIRQASGDCCWESQDEISAGSGIAADFCSGCIKNHTNLMRDLGHKSVQTFADTA